MFGDASRRERGRAEVLGSGPASTDEGEVPGSAEGAFSGLHMEAGHWLFKPWVRGCCRVYRRGRQSGNRREERHELILIQFVLDVPAFEA